VKTSDRQDASAFTRACQENVLTPGFLSPGFCQEEFEQTSEAMRSDGTAASGGKPKAGLPPLTQALEIPSGFPHSHRSAAAFSTK
jgi:hypothetical protein